MSYLEYVNLVGLFLLLVGRLNLKIFLCILAFQYKPNADLIMKTIPALKQWQSR